MEIAERSVRVELKAPPDARFDIQQRDLELKVGRHDEQRTGKLAWCPASAGSSERRSARHPQAVFAYLDYLQRQVARDRAACR